MPQVKPHHTQVVIEYASTMPSVTLSLQRFTDDERKEILRDLSGKMYFDSAGVRYKVFLKENTETKKWEYLLVNDEPIKVRNQVIKGRYFYDYQSGKFIRYEKINSHEDNFGGILLMKESPPVITATNQNRVNGDKILINRKFNK